jgi:hypothetical protein
MLVADLKPDDQLHPELALLMAALEDSSKEWLSNLGEVPDEAVTWQLYKDGPSIGGIILHMVSCGLLVQ